MCAAAISFARLRRVVFGAYDPKGGGVDHGSRLFDNYGALSKHVEGVLSRGEAASVGLVSQYKGHFGEQVFAEHLRE